MADRTTKMKKINEQKLQAFTIGSMGKRGLSKKEQDELRKKEEDEAAAHAFQEFVETFQETPNKTSKVWVKAGTYDAGARKEDTKDRGKLYKPSSRISEMHEKTSAEKAQEYARLLSSNDRKPDRLGKKRGDKDKKKSNLELFKEELKMIQEEREERHKYKGVVKTQMTTNFEVEKEIIMLRDASGELGSFDNGDPTTTNLYLGNLNPKISEQQLMEVFGKHGPLASIKIMWPRSEEEKARGRNCGFVAFMNRQDGERALKSLNGRDVMNYEMKLGWGKSVPIPPHPIYIPDSLVQLTLPPPSSGLPFNAQLAPKHMRMIGNTRFDESYMTHPETKDKVDQILYKAVVKVVMPTDRNLLMLIHRMVEFVIREGPMFEAMIMNREINNPMFRFLFENQSPAHCYYRWKLFSLLQGEPQREWNQTEFRMFEGGSIWKPPPINLYTQGMPEELIIEEEINEPNKGSLSATQRERLQDLLRFLSPERTKIAKAMVFCLEHADAADEISDCIEEALASPTTPIPRKLARLFLVSDILGNCAAKITNASYFRRAFETRLMKIFTHVNETYKNMESRLKAESFKSRVMLILRAWEDWAIFSSDFLQRCHNTFHGVVPSDENDITDDVDGDGAPMSAGEADEDLDGVPLDGAALLKGAMLRGLPQVTSSPNIVKNNSRTEEYDEEDNIEGKLSAESTKLSQPVVTSGGFVPSRWETVDPDQVEAQAITTSKWDTLEPPPPKSPSPPRITIKQGSNDSEDSQSSISQADSSSRDLDEERRTKLREIEVKSVQYQDELESGSRSLKSGWTIQQQVEHYRRKLIRKSDREAIVKSQSPERAEKRSKKERKERLKKSASPLEQNLSRHQSRSPHSSKKSPTSRKRSPTSSSHGKRRASASPDSQSPERKHYRSSVSPDRKCKHLYNNLSPVRSKYGRVATPSPPRNMKYDSPYSRQRSPSPVVSKSVRYASPSPPPRSKHKNTSPRNKHRKQISPSPPPRISKHSHREREESSSRKHKHKYKY